MRVLIDIPEQDYELACNYPEVLFGSYAQFIKKGTVIPDNATNGDMIKVMFPNAEIKRGFYGIERAPLVCLDLHTSFKVIEVSCLEDWWNAPYKKEEANNGSNEQ